MRLRYRIRASYHYLLCALVTGRLPGLRAQQQRHVLHGAPHRPLGAHLADEGVCGGSTTVVVSRTDDGRARLDFNNARPDELEVLFTARRAAP